MEYLRQFFGKAWSDRWNIVFNAPWVTVLLAILIFGLSTLIHWHRKGFSDVRDALIVASEGAIATLIILACVFAFHFLFLTPKKINEALLKQIHPKLVDEPRIKLDVADTDARTELAEANNKISSLQTQLTKAKKEAQAALDPLSKPITSARFTVIIEFASLAEKKSRYLGDGCFVTLAHGTTALLGGEALTTCRTGGASLDL